MSISLTREEIEQVLNAWTGGKTILTGPQAVAKAQLKKDIKNILDYGEDRFLEMCMEEVSKGDYRTLLEEIA